MVDNRELRRLIGYKVGKFNDETLTEDDLISVKDLGVSGKTLDGQDLQIDLEELKKLSSLELLSINQMDLDNRLIGIIGSLPRLRTLMLAKCNITQNTIVGLDNINSLIINTCKMEDNVQISLPEDATIAGQDINLENVMSKRIKRLVLTGCKVPSLKPLLKCGTLEKLSLEGTSIEDDSLAEVKNKLDVSEREDSNPIR